MNATQSTRRSYGIADRLDLEQFDLVCAELAGWRIDPFIQMMERGRVEGRVLAFVRGLRLSARLIYAIRKQLSGTNLQADWGQILDDEGGVKCSPECDVIIHRPGILRRWNGTDKPVMDFNFVEQKHAVAVISCKSYIRSVGQEYKDYCGKVRDYVENVWLFAECCRPSAVERLQRSSMEAGYGKFWYLYTWDGESSIQQNQQGWFDFLEAIASLDRPPSS